MVEYILLVGPIAGGVHCVMIGTSMAAPTVTGSSALLLEDFRNQFPDKPDFLPSTLKVLLAHNAMDLFEPGPDYQSGYGLMQITDTIDFMRTDSFLEASVDQGGIYSFNVNVPPSASELKATLAWDDFPATFNVEIALINDLDIIAIEPDGVTTHYPWTLDQFNPSVDALRIEVNHKDNIEQVYVQSPSPGTWTIEIRGYNVPEGPQNFSVAVSPSMTESNIPGDINGDGFVNVLDLIDLLLCFGQPAQPICEAEDLDGDGFVNVLDMIEVLLNFGAGDFPECNDGNDNDLDNMTDSADPGCWTDPNNSSTYDFQDNDESNCGDNVCEGGETPVSCTADCPIFECNDGIDNDLDGFCDTVGVICTDGTNPGDSGCGNPTDDDESDCGDGICEGGEDNVSCLADCGVPSTLLVFVSDNRTDGRIGINAMDALTNADALCNNEAANNSYPGTYAAWLSNDNVNAKDRIVDGEYRNIFDQVIANNMTDLLDGLLNNSIHTLVTSAWTGTRFDGTAAAGCDDWTTSSSSILARFGFAHEITSKWTYQTAAGGCNGNRKLYCFQVS